MQQSIVPTSQSKDAKSILTLMNLDEAQFHHLFAESAKKIDSDFESLTDAEISDFKNAAYDLQKSGKIPPLLDDSGNFLIPLEDLIKSWHLPK